MENKYKYIYFIGIGGIGMSALARYYRSKGKIVSGYDRVESKLSKELITEGIEVHYEDNITSIPKEKDECLVIYTPAVDPQLKELKYVQKNGYKLIKRSQALGLICKEHYCIAIAGTHGKTSISSQTAHILKQLASCSAFLGGIAKNFNSNLVLAPDIDTSPIVVEADEFDRSFLQLYPSVALISAIEADHLDIYGDFGKVQEAFNDFASQVKDSLIIKYDAKYLLKKDKIRAKILTYHYDNPKADFHAINHHKDAQGFFYFDLIHPKGIIKNIKTACIGRLNAENSIAAAAICLSVESTKYNINEQNIEEKIKEAIASFKGVKRRMELHFSCDKCIYIDDYAHHPQELNTALNSLKEIFPDKKITAVFQPHLYTRTRDFAQEFAQVLSIPDKLILLDIYPAREKAIEGINSEMLLRQIQLDNKFLLSKEELLKHLRHTDNELLVTFGAGDIDRLVEPIVSLLKSKYNE